MKKELNTLYKQLKKAGLNSYASKVATIYKRAGEIEDDITARGMGYKYDAADNTDNPKRSESDICNFVFGYMNFLLTTSYDFLRERAEAFKQYAREKYTFEPSYNPIRVMSLHKGSEHYDQKDIEEAKIYAYGGDKNDLLKKKDAIMSMIELANAISDKDSNRKLENANNIINNNEIVSNAFSEINDSFSGKNAEEKDFSMISDKDVDYKVKRFQREISRINRVLKYNYGVE